MLKATSVMRGGILGDNGWLRYDGGCIGKGNETQVSKKRKKIRRTQRGESEQCHFSV